MSDESPQLTRDEARFILQNLPFCRTDLATNPDNERSIRDRLLVKLGYAFGDGSVASGRTPTVGYKVIDENPAHTRISVWVGRTRGARGHSGTLVIRTDELDAVLHGWERLDEPTKEKPE